MSYDTWKSTEPQYGIPCCDCGRREADASDGLCSECANDAAQAEQLADESRQLSLTEELDAREADAADELFDLARGA